MNINIKLDKNFTAIFNKLVEEGGEEMAKLNGVSSDHLSYTDFIDHFVDNKVVADASIDGNSNVRSKDICTLLNEMSKPHLKMLAFNKIFYELNKKYGYKAACAWLEGEWRGDFYLHDSSSSTTVSYCYSYDISELVKRGLFFIPDFNAQPPKHLTTFTDFVGEFVSWTSNRTSGACGFASFLIYSYYFWKKDVEENYFVKSPEYYRDQEFQRIIFKLNQPYLRVAQCVTEDTEVLTPDGFKTYDQLSVGDSIYTWNDGKCEVQAVQAVNVQDHDGEIHEYGGRDLQFSVTPNHRVLYKKFNSDEYSLKESSDLIDLKTPITIPVGMDNDFVDYDISDDMLELVTIVLCDGSVVSSEGRSDKISIIKSERRYGNERIKELLDKLGLDYIQDSKHSKFAGVSDEKNEYLVYVYRLSVENSKKILGLIDHTKKRLPDFFRKLSMRQAQLVIDTWCQFDGFDDVKNNRRKLQCDSYEIADALQHVCFLAGLGSRIMERTINGNQNPTIHVVPYVRKHKDVREKKRSHYRGKVWCPTTENGVVVFRKDGRIFISGNSAFTNFSIFDRTYLIELFGGREFPDGTFIIDYIDDIIEYQKAFMEVVSDIRSQNMMTFPVLTFALLRKDGKFDDEEFAKWCCKHNMRWADSNFFISSDVTTLSNCCRLTSDITSLSKDNKPFFNSVGGTALEVGSVKVNTINLARISYLSGGCEDAYLAELEERVISCCQTLDVVRNIIIRNVEKGLLPNYSLGLINIASQYNTIGIIGIYETLDKFGYVYQDEFGYTFYKNEGVEFAKRILAKISEVKDAFIADNGCDYMINIEQVPAERAAYILMEKDRHFFPGEKYELPLYANQWIPLAVKCTLNEKIRLSAILDKACNGGSISHINLDAPLVNFDSAWQLLNHVADSGVVYFAFCLRISACKNNHGFYGDVCPECGEEKTTTYQRIVGFLTAETTYSKERKCEFRKRDWIEVDRLSDI